MTPIMGLLFENSSASRGTQIWNDYDSDFFLDLDYNSSNIFVRYINDYQSIFVDFANIKPSCSPFELRKISDPMFSESNIWLISKFILQTSKLILVIVTWKLPRLSIYLLLLWMVWRSHSLAHRKRLKSWELKLACSNFRVALFSFYLL